MTPDTKAEGFVAGTRKIVQILRYGPRELALALLGLLLLGAIALLPKLVEMLPFLAPAQPWLTGGLAVLGLFLLVLSIRRIWKKAVAPLPEGKPKPAAIKGPAPFGPQDAELFARLGRNDDLDKLRGWILDDQKPLVALMGESGVGKTSLLRAGLAHHLQDDKVPVLYWEAVPTEPEAKLLHAARMGWEDEAKAPKTFEELEAAVASGRRVVVIDQAEQLSPEGHPRIFELLRQVATADPPYRATWVVAFRREFLPVWRDFELGLPETVQRRMETLPLQRFLPRAAEKVIAVLAEEGSLPVDQKLVEELVKGVAVEGKVSPADIGISLLVLSELAGGRPDASLSLDDFRESGGQAGLLTRYLQELLELFPEAERPDVLRGLLALVDLEKDQRLAEGRTLAELEEVTKPASPLRFAAALRFFASGKARVLEELPGELYRLVHERLIPAIRRLTGVLLAEAERASLALERGYRVWAQDRRSRYLLHRWDLKEVLRHKDQIRWGKDEADKRELVRLSLRRTRRNRYALVAATLALFVAASGLMQYSQRREYQSLLATWGLPPDLYDHLGQLEELTLPGTVTRVDWLRRASNLKTLTIEDGSLASLEGLPSGLETLRVGDSRLPTFTGIPASLRSLSLGTSLIERYEVLPSGLNSLDLEIARGVQWNPDTLPRSLVSLRLSLPYMGVVPDFRTWKDLKSLTLQAMGNESQLYEVASLRGLPKDLRSLEVRGFQLDNFYGLPHDLQSLSVDMPPVQWSYAELPKNLKQLGFTIFTEPSSIEVSLPLLAATDLPLLSSLILALPSEGALRLDLSRFTRPLNSLAIFSNGGLHIKGLPQGLESLKILADWVLLREDLPLSLRQLEMPAALSVIKNQRAWPLFLDPSSFDPEQDLKLLAEAHRTLLPPNLVSLTVEQSNTERIPLPLFRSFRLDQLARLKRLRSLKLEGIRILGGFPRVLNRLEELSLRGKQIEELPDSLNSLIRLDISATPLQLLKGLPPRLQSLSLSVNQVKNLQGLPSAVTALHFHGTPAESPDIQGRPAGRQRSQGKLPPPGLRPRETVLQSTVLRTSHRRSCSTLNMGLPFSRFR